jgi:hypothetical protein
MKMSIMLLLATVIPLSWLVLGAIMLWRHAMLHRSETKFVLASLLTALRRFPACCKSQFEFSRAPSVRRSAL